MKFWIIAIIFSHTAVSFAQSKDTVYVFGPGGPLAPMQECAEAFTKATGIPVRVTGGPEATWLSQAQTDGDIIYGGAEYMLTQFGQNHPGIIDAASRVELYPRRAAILVRPGNPKRITRLKDLAAPGIKILDVNGAGQLGLWEDLAGKENLISTVQKNIARSFVNTALGINAWKTDPAYDAWITYASWHYRLSDVTGIVELPITLRLYRGTPAVLTLHGRHHSEAGRFLSYLKSAEGHSIFKKWGWE
ncbi:solute-binding protein [Mucilaginibacter robiniae]|uniref:Solute-binding protein n=1 Tax=Mucilaginibacter robiniae TaxID=2728022 RepID=A0A7L5DYH5_9SPHI|nr:substrate-binding domain-containing protein [Mucilaginibacter robiniae]QJD96065.1 solute-binding protein [Mucilaginibacter robiniae]